MSGSERIDKASVMGRAMENRSPKERRNPRDNWSGSSASSLKLTIETLRMPSFIMLMGQFAMLNASR